MDTCKSGHYKATTGRSWLHCSIIICPAQQEAANVMCVYMADLLQGGVLTRGNSRWPDQP